MNKQTKFKVRLSLNIVGLTILMSGLSGCQQQQSQTDAMSSESADEPSAPAEAADQKTRALAAKSALFERLSTRLMQAMSNGGPTAAIEVCSKEAQTIAIEVGQEHHVKIGRTSFKLRNSNNTPPKWANQFVNDRSSEPQFVDMPDGRFGAFLPIKLMAQCMTCHGPTDQIDEQVLTTLRKLYPDDQATGFSIDDLRGWFWVEVPADTIDG